MDEVKREDLVRATNSRVRELEARQVGAAVFLKQNLEWPEVVREWPSEKG